MNVTHNRRKMCVGVIVRNFPPTFSFLVFKENYNSLWTLVWSYVTFSTVYDVGCIGMKSKRSYLWSEKYARRYKLSDVSYIESQSFLKRNIVCFFTERFRGKFYHSSSRYDYKQSELFSKALSVTLNGYSSHASHFPLSLHPSSSFSLLLLLFFFLFNLSNWNNLLRISFLSIF